MSNIQNVYDLPFGLNVITKYSNGKITATMTHGDNIKTTVKVSYDCALSTSENHYNACQGTLNKRYSDHNKSFVVVYHSYNEKDNGYCFTSIRND